MTCGGTGGTGGSAAACAKRIMNNYVSFENGDRNHAADRPSVRPSASDLATIFRQGLMGTEERSEREVMRREGGRRGQSWFGYCRTFVNSVVLLEIFSCNPGFKLA